MDVLVSLMEVVHKSIIESYQDTKIYFGLDKDDKVYVYYRNIDLLYKKKVLLPLTGRGDTFELAYIDLLTKMMDKQCTLRYKTKFYATRNIRNIIKKSKILESEAYYG